MEKSKREIKKECYIEILGDSIINVETNANYLIKVKQRQGVIKEEILLREKYRTYYNLELALASMCVLIRKMAENNFITISRPIRDDLNSVIHSNRFEYHNEDFIYVYSQKGKEDVSMRKLLQFAKEIVDGGNAQKI